MPGGSSAYDLKGVGPFIRGVTETEVVTHTGSVTMKNVTILPARLVRGLNSVPPPPAK